MAHDENTTHFWSALWFIIVTTATVGYGDQTPRTQLGRLCAAGAAIVGTFYAALLASSLSNALAWTTKENAAVLLIRRQYFRDKLRERAVTMIEMFVRRKKKEMDEARAAAQGGAPSARETHRDDKDDYGSASHRHASWSRLELRDIEDEGDEDKDGKRRVEKKKPDSETVSSKQRERRRSVEEAGLPANLLFAATNGERRNSLEGGRGRRGSLQHPRKHSLKTFGAGASFDSEVGSGGGGGRRLSDEQLKNLKDAVLGTFDSNSGSVSASGTPMGVPEGWDAALLSDETLDQLHQSLKSAAHV